MNQLPPCPYQLRCPTYRPLSTHAVRCWANVGGECQAHIRLQKQTDKYIYNKNNNKSMELKCKCGKEWDYQGGNKVKATCPDCHRLVDLPEEA